MLGREVGNCAGESVGEFGTGDCVGAVGIDDGSNEGFVEGE